MRRSPAKRGGGRGREKKAKSRRCCLVGVCKYFLFCYPLGEDSPNLGEQRRQKAASSPSSHGLSLSLCPSTLKLLKSSSRRRLPRLQVAASSGSRHGGWDDARRPSRRRDESGEARAVIKDARRGRRPGGQPALVTKVLNRRPRHLAAELSLWCLAGYSSHLARYSRF